MIGVDLIGGIRRAYFEQRWPIKEIVRRLAVSRATVRRVIRSQKTEFSKLNSHQQWSKSFHLRSPPQLYDPSHLSLN